MTLTADELAGAREDLARRDPALARVHAQTPVFEWRVRQGGFEGLIRMIIEQQVSVASAVAVWARMTDGMGNGGALTPQDVLRFDAEAMRVFGVSRQKAGYIRDIAAAQVEGGIDLDHMARLPDDEAVAALVRLRGVGLWTAEAYLLMCEGRTDVFPGGDVALQEAIRWADGAEARPDQAQAYARAEAWRPWRGVATHLLWAWYVGIKRGQIDRSRPPAT